MAKRREREYTPEEAMAITLREVTPLWYFSEPLLVGGIDAAGARYPQPLVAEIQKGIWVAFFSSATSPAFERVREMFRIFERRYQSLSVNFIFSFRVDYAFYRERKAVESWLKKIGISAPAVCDFDGSIAEAFSVNREPGLAILRDGEIIYASAGKDWLDRAEWVLQELLRRESPGLPFWPPASEECEPVVRREAWSLRADSPEIRSGKIELIGNWSLEEDRITTTDSKAELRFTSPGSAIEIVGRSLSDMGDPTRIRFDTQGASFSENFAGRDFSSDDEGNSTLFLSEVRGYSALRNLPTHLRKIRFRFPFAKVNPVALYGLEFGEIV